MTDGGNKYAADFTETSLENSISSLTIGEFFEIGRYHGTMDPCDKDIWFGIKKAGAAKELQALKARIERTLSSLRLIFSVENVGAQQAARNRANFDTAFEKLLSLAAIGLSTAQPDPAIAAAALDALQSEIVDREAGRMKNAYMVRLGIPALISSTFFAAMFFLYEYIEKDLRWPAEIFAHRHVFLVLSGCMAGTWASFAARKVVLGFLDLAALEQDRLNPGMRLAFTGILTVFLTLVVITGMLDIVVGGFHASAIVRSGTVSLLFGAFTGLTEQTLPAALFDRAKNFSQAISKTD